MIKAIPNALTLGNLIAGCCAIAALFEGMPHVTLLLALLCLVLDLLDGFLARRLNVSSALGIQLDSLADLVSFGVLPGCILFVLVEDSCGFPAGGKWLPYLAFLVTAGATLRLARFNVDTRERSVFFGLPTPSAGAFLFGLLWMQITTHAWWEYCCQPVLLYGLILLLPFLMLSSIRLWSLKGLGQPNGRWILGGMLIVFVALIVFLGSASVSVMVLLYILFGIVNYSLKLY